MNLSNSEQLSYSTIRIECQFRDGTTGTGTGFYFSFFNNKETGSHVPLLITNNHVINNSVKGRLIFCKSAADNTPLDTVQIPIEVDNFEGRWVKHPDNNVDLCAMPLSEILTEILKGGNAVFNVWSDKTIIPNSEQLLSLSALEEILMIGYPNGIWDSYNNKPILRRGITATHPKLDYEGKKEFLIDAAIFPGSSGSPVYLFNEGTYTTREGATVIGSRILLLGILYAGPHYTIAGELKIVNVPTSVQAIVHSLIPNNLGLVIRSERILEFEPFFKPK